MKIPIFSLILLLAAWTFTSCQDTNTLTKEERMQEIASSELFAKHMENFYESARMISAGMVDLPAIGKVLETYPDEKDLKKEYFENIRGGVQWYENRIERQFLRRQLDEQLQYSKFSLEEKIKIKEIFEASYPEKVETLRISAFDRVRKNQKK